MRILILGAGAIGGYFGARLIESEQAVDFLLRPARAERLRAQGLRVTSSNGDFTQPISCVTETTGEYSLVVLSCKSYDLDSAIKAISPAVGKHTQVLPLLNGLAHMDALDSAFGSERVLGGFAHISVTVKPDGSIEQFGDVARLVYGPRDGRDVNDAITRAMASMHAQVIQTPAIVQLMWQKFALITALAGATCVCRGSVGDILATVDGREFIERLYRECCAIAYASGYALSADMQAEALAALTNPTPLKASMLRDIEAGTRSEGEHIIGDMLRRAKALDVDAPILLAVATHVRVYDRSRAIR